MAPVRRMLSLSAGGAHALEWRRLADICNALGHPLRLRILFSLLSGPCRVVELSRKEFMPNQSTLAYHLMDLRHSRIVQVEQNGSARYYRFASPEIERVVRAVAATYAT